MFSYYRMCSLTIECVLFVGGTGARAISTTAARSGGVLKVTAIIILLVRCSMAGNRICVKEDEHREVAEGRVRRV